MLQTLWLAGMPMYIPFIGVLATMLVAKYEEESIYYPAILCTIIVILHILPFEIWSLYAIASLPGVLIVWVFAYLWKKVN